MSQIKIPNVLSNLPTAIEFQRFCAAFINDLVSKFNGQIDFVTNIRASGAGVGSGSSAPYEATFSSPSNVQGINHGLGTIPKGFIIVNLSASANIYAPSGTAYTWTNAKIYLQSSAAVTAKLYVI